MIFTYEELSKEIDEQRARMSDNEKYIRLSQCDPTFEEFVITSVKPGESVEIDFEHNDFTVTTKDGVICQMNSPSQSVMTWQEKAKLDRIDEQEALDYHNRTFQ